MVFRQVVRVLALLSTSLFLSLAVLASCAFTSRADHPTIKWYVFFAEQGLFVRDRKKDDVKTLKEADKMYCTDRESIKQLGESLHIYFEQARESK